MIKEEIIMANAKTQKKRAKKAANAAMGHSGKGYANYPVSGGKVTTQAKAMGNVGKYHNKIG